MNTPKPDFSSNEHVNWLAHGRQQLQFLIFHCSDIFPTSESFNIYIIGYSNTLVVRNFITGG